MNTSSAVSTLKDWILENVDSNLVIYSDSFPEPEGDMIAIQSDPSPSLVSSYLDDMENGVPDRRVLRTFTFLSRSKDSCYARNILERIVNTLDGAAVDCEDGTQIDCGSPKTASFVGSDNKEQSVYTASIECQYDINELEEILTNGNND